MMGSRTRAVSNLQQSKPFIGHILVDHNVITQEQLAIALERQKESRCELGKTLMELNFISNEAVLLPHLGRQMGVTFVNLKESTIPPEIITLIPAQFATNYRVVPVKLESGILTVATASPRDIFFLDELSLAVSYPLKPVLAGTKDIDEAIRFYYGVGAETIEQMMGRSASVEPRQEEIDDLEDTNSEASISKFLNQILLEAYKDGATDIHIEPFVGKLAVRYRIDGMLCDAKVPKNIYHFQDAICSRIKILSNLDIAEKRLPQDGRFKIRVGSVDLDLRVSFLPTPCGESAVIRLLNASRLYSLAELGLPETERCLLEELTERPNGIIFLTGPTGSGKTTTLYACLARMETGRHKIITIEDPIEYQLAGITQVQINPAAGLTFAQGLRSMLRHDPDIMMVGEVRDKETATIAVQVALTGHLVFSTLHTNDALSGIARLLDMGIEPYLITSTVQCFIAQRLVRKVCEHCRRPVPVTQAVIEKFHLEGSVNSGQVIYESAGCDACHQTGFSGREAIYEFLVLCDTIREMILNKASARAMREAALARGMKTLRHAGFQKVLSGCTTVQEVLRVTQDGTQD